MVRIDSPAVFGGPHVAWQGFVDRLSRLEDVQAIEIDRERGSATVRFDKASSDTKPLMERMAQALATPALVPGSSSIVGLSDHLAGRRWIRLFRRGAAFSSWELVHELPGRLRVRDVGLRGRTDLVRQLELELHTLPGVHTVTASPTTGSILVRFDPATIDRESVLAALDDSVRSSDLIAATRGMPERASFTLANTTLVLATVGEFLFPAVLPVSAVLLVAGNLSNFHGAVRDLRERRLGLPLLQTSIVAGTLVTGGFIASSLMSWLMLFWQNRHARQVATARQILGSTVRKQHRTAWVCRDGVELETPTNRLQPGDVISVHGGDMLPVDGRILSGTALVDESVVRGATGLVCRSVEQTILRGSLVVEGELRVEVAQCGENTVAERIGQALDAATHHTSVSLKHAPPAIAQRAVSPVLFAAGVGLMVGDATTAAAIMRPDYSTGPGIGGALSLVHQLGTCLQAGVVVRQARAFAAMAAVDTVLIDDHPALRRREIELAEVHAIGPLTENEILQYTESALRGICDPRGRALAAACADRLIAPLDLPISSRNGDIELWDRGRLIRITGLAQLHTCTCQATETGSVDLERTAGVLKLFCDGEPAGSLCFRSGSRLEAQPGLARLRTENELQVALLVSDPESAADVERLSLDFHCICPSDEAKAAYITRCRRAGHRLAYVGDCRKNPLAAAAADVSIAPVTDPGDDLDPADVWLLQADYGRIAEFREVARKSRRHEQMHHGMTLIPNLTCVAGAFFFGFTSLAAVIISNMGTYTVYQRSMKELRQTERQLLGRRIPQRSQRTNRPQRRIDAAEAPASIADGQPQDPVHV